MYSEQLHMMQGGYITGTELTNEKKEILSIQGYN